MAKGAIARLHARALIGAAMALVLAACGTAAPARAPDAPAPRSVLSLDAAERRAIADYAYAVLDRSFAATEEPAGAPPLPALAYDRLYITCYYGTRIRGSQSGTTPAGTPDRLARDIEEAVRRCAADDRFEGPISAAEAPGTTLVFTFAFNPVRLGRTDLDSLEGSVELGIHAVRVRQGERGAFFKETVPITANLRHESLFDGCARRRGWKRVATPSRTPS